MGDSGRDRAYLIQRVDCNWHLGLEVYTEYPDALPESMDEIRWYGCLPRSDPWEMTRTKHTIVGGPIIDIGLRSATFPWEADAAPANQRRNAELLLSTGRLNQHPLPGRAASAHGQKQVRTRSDCNRARRRRQPGCLANRAHYYWRRGVAFRHCLPLVFYDDATHGDATPGDGFFAADLRRRPWMAGSRRVRSRARVSSCALPRQASPW